MKIKIFINKLTNKIIDDVYIKFPGDLDPILKGIDSSNLEPIQRTMERALENIKIWEEAPRPIDDVFFRSNDNKFNALMETVEKDFNDANVAVLRRMDDVYRQTIFKTQVHYNTGTITLDKAIDMATKDFLEKGIDAITYSDGKKVNIASYAEMALRTTNHRAYLMGEGKNRQEIGIPFVVASAHATACKLCVPWQGKILIDDIYSSGKKEDGSYPLLSEAMEKGFLHPNCRHNLSTYFPGITTLPKVPDEERALENYKYEQQQRYIERQIRKYKRLAEGSINLYNQAKYGEKVKEWQTKQREHLKENSQLRRKYNKEQVKASTSLTDDEQKVNIKINQKQFGKKIGKHAEDYGLDATKAEDRVKMNDIINDIVQNHSEVRIGSWMGQGDQDPVTKKRADADVWFLIKDNDVVIINDKNEFVTILKDGVINNTRVKTSKVKMKR
nr:phage minor capsid protein [Tissierella praeacuta]